MRFVAALALLLVCTCVRDLKLDGHWLEPSKEWGQVLFVGTKGTYSATYGPGPGEFRLTKVGDGYEGTWGEGPTRHGLITQS